MLWDLIRDFFVIHVFGGYDSQMIYYGPMVGYDYLDQDFYSTADFNYEFLGRNITLGDWLSTTATIISITIIVVLCAMFIYKIVRLVGGLIR